MFSLADRLYRVLLTAVTLLLGALTVVVSYQVISRYVPFVPRALWTEEISRLCLEWTVFLGAALAVRRSEHFIIDAIPRRVEQRIIKPLQVVVLVLVGVSGAVIVLGGLGFAETGLSRTSTTSGIQLVWAYSALPVAGACIVFFALELVVRLFRGQSITEHSESLTAEAGPSSEPVPLGVGE